MGIEKQGSKGGGGYVGGFLQLFDWNGKSRKKLFSSKSDFPEGSKQGKKSEGNLPMTRVRAIDEDDNGGSSSIKGNSDYSCASSVTDEGNGGKGPGVVARLMGLDSMPTSSITEPYSTPFFDTISLQDAHCYRRNPEYQSNPEITHSFNQSNKVEGFLRVDSRPLKIRNRPIERFQTETLPPKSAKSIPITHHKLLSPIKSPGFIPYKNAAHIMEAAAKIIETGPQTCTKAKITSAASSSLPLKVRDLKERMEAARRPCTLPEESQRPVKSNSVKCLKGQSLDKSWNGPEGATYFRDSSHLAENNFAGSKNKEKSISLAIQAKANVQKRECLNSRGSRRSPDKKDHNEAISAPHFKGQLNTKKGMQKKSPTQSASGVLRTNNQKQNCIPNKDKLVSKPSVSSQQCRKNPPGNTSFGRNKTLNKVVGSPKVGSRKMDLEVIDTEKEVRSSGTKNCPRKKRTIAAGIQFENNGVFESVLNAKHEKPIQSHLTTEKHLQWTEDNRNKGMDVVSFTFTSPMIKSAPRSHFSCQVVEKHGYPCTNYEGEKIPDGLKSTKLSSLGLNMMGGDALSILLEQKLRELKYGGNYSLHNSAKAESVATSASTVEDLVSAPNDARTTAPEHDKTSQFAMCIDKFNSIYDSDCSSTDDQMLKLNHKLQEVDAMSEVTVSNTEARKKLDCRQPSPVSILQPCFSNDSCNTSDNGDSSSTTSSKQCSSFLTQEASIFSLGCKSQSVETETDLSDSASSTSISTTTVKSQIKTLKMADCGSKTWELEYVRDMLCNAELMFKNYASGRSRQLINPHLFDQLENRKSGPVADGEEEDSRLRRKVLFDCVSECLDLRCKQYLGGSCRAWIKGMAMVRQRECLAEQVFKEISGWRSMADWMVDELVDKDMSSHYGTWLQFDTEAFEVGLEIESRILSSLVNEVLVDIFLG